MSSRQLAKAALEGREVTFHFLSDVLDPITGYLCGMDDFHWMVVSPPTGKHLIHKSAARVDLHSESTYDEECQRNPTFKAEADDVVLPFRRWVEREFFGRSSESASSERTASA